MNKEYYILFENYNFEAEPIRIRQDQAQNPREDINLDSSNISQYEVVPNEGDDSEGEEFKKLNNKTLARNYLAREKLHLSLTSDKIAGKSHKSQAGTMMNNNNAKINKSMGMDCRVLKTKNHNDEDQQPQPQQQQQSRVKINFKIAPFNNSTKHVGEEEQNLQAIDLTSSDMARSNAIMPPTSTLKNQNQSRKYNCVKFQGLAQQIKSVTRRGETSDSVTTDTEESSDLNSLAGGNSTSPESILDNVLSAASSVSVRNSSSNSSLSSVNSDVTQLGFKESNLRAMTPVVIITPNEEFNGNMPKVDNTKSQKQLLDISPMYKKISTTPQLTPTSTFNSFSSLRSQHSRTPSPSASTILLQQQQQHNLNTSLYPDEFKCKICVQIYQDPRTLNCLHSFCYQCLVNETYKPDTNLSPWPHASTETNDSKVMNASNGNERSNALDVANTSPIRSRMSSPLNFIRKKSLDKIIVKQKSDLKLNSMNSISSRLNIQNADENKVRYVACKICNFLTELPLGGLRQLPQNILMLRKIEDFKFKAGNDVINKIWCSLCYDDISATFHCLKCNLNLCTLCKEAHERQRNTTNHTIKNIMDVRRSKRQRESILDTSKSTLKCTLHPGSELKAFCATCLQVSCADCLVTSHKNHKIESMQKAANYYAKILRDNIEQTRPLCNYAEHSIERLNDIAKGINKKCDDIQAEVEYFLKQYFEALEVHRRTLLQQVHKARESKVEMIIEQQLDLEKRITEAMDVVRFTQDLTDKATDAEILSFLSLLLKRFEYCQQFKTPVDPKISDSLHFLPKIRAPSTKTQNDIPLFGIITMQTVEPGLCTLQTENVAHLRLHKKIELTLITRDADNVELCHGGVDILALLKYKENNAKCLPVEVSDNRDGTYLICFTPDSQGTLILTVLINDKPIKGNPFSFLARTVRPHNGIYHCCAFCSSKSSKLTKCACDGRMPGYEGCGHGHAGHPGRRHWSCCANILENSECTLTNKLLNSQP